MQYIKNLMEKWQLRPMTLRRIESMKEFNRVVDEHLYNWDDKERNAVPSWKCRLAAFHDYRIAKVYKLLRKRRVGAIFGK